MKVFSKIEVELLKCVLEDLYLLDEELSKKPPSPAKVRQVSVILRRLVVESNLQKAWRLCGYEKQPQIPLPQVPVAQLHHKEGLVFAQDGGADMGLGMVGGIRIYQTVKTDEEIKRHFEELQRKLTEPPQVVGLTEFIETPAIWYKGRRVARRELIQYVANKLGGAHFDHKSRDQDLEVIRNHIGIAEQDPVFFEIIAIAQNILKSEDIRRLISKIQDALKES